MKIHARRLQSKRGIALFILLTSLIIMGLAVRELMQMTGLQAERVRYQYHRLQAIYLARSTQNLARFILAFDLFQDEKMKKDDAADSSEDLWNLPIPFPIPIEFVQAFSGKIAESAGVEGGGESQASPMSEELSKSCKEFFGDFPGEAEYQIEDLSARLNLNDLASKDTFETLVDLFKINPEMLQNLNMKGIQPESLAREFRDYMDENTIEEETNGSEEDVYRSAQLEYKPKNYIYTTNDEIRLIPSMDDEIDEFISPHVLATYIPSRNASKINLNTVSKTLFQALLKNVSDTEQIAENFIKDRTEKKRVYTKKNAIKQLEDNVGLDSERIRTSLLAGVSDAFRIRTKARVSEVEIELDSIQGRGYKKPADPISQSRVSP